MAKVADTIGAWLGRRVALLLALGLGVSMAFTLIVLPAWLKVFGGAAQRAA